MFVQSHVRAHVELMWLLSSATPIGWLNRMIQFKEKSRKAVRFNCTEASSSLIYSPLLCNPSYQVVHEFASLLLVLVHCCCYAHSS